MRVLATNDDGIESPGLHVLAGALAAAGHEVLVVAPLTDRSGASAAIGPLPLGGPIPVHERPTPALADVTLLAIDAPPATAVHAAILGAWGDPPEVVVSGINPGANTGHLVLHSGTVGAALTAAGLGVAGLAVSLEWSDAGDYHWSTAAILAIGALEWVTADPSPRVLNLNVPNREPDQVRGVREAALAPYGQVWVASAGVSGGDLRMEFQGADTDPDAETDLVLLRQGWATVTPLTGVERATTTGAAEATMRALKATRSGADPAPTP